MNKLAAIGLCTVMCISVVLGHSNLEVKAGAIHTENIVVDQEVFGEPDGLIDSDWKYDYHTTEYGYDKLVGVWYINDYYTYLYDEHGMIVGLVDDEGTQVVRYTYNNNNMVEDVYSYSNDGWVINSSENFIGNLNKMRFLGYYFDEATQCYYIGGTYFDPVLDRYLGMTNNSALYTNYNPFAVSEEGIQPMSDVMVANQVAQQWADALCADGNHGIPINYSSGWYSNLSDVELLSRAIYAEGGTQYTNEGSAVAWVIRNRVASSAFSGQTGAEIVKEQYQFTSITGNMRQTENARTQGFIYNPDTGQIEPAAGARERWEHATYLACLMITTGNDSYWKQLVGNTLNGQLYFYSYTTAQNGYNQNGGPFYSSGNMHYYNGNAITDVKVLGYSNFSSFNTMFQNYNPTAYSRNIYYNYTN